MHSTWTHSHTLQRAKAPPSASSSPEVAHNAATPVGHTRCGPRRVLGANLLTLTSKACTPSQPPWDPSSARSHRRPLRTKEVPTYTRMRHRMACHVPSSATVVCVYQRPRWVGTAERSNACVRRGGSGGEATSQPDVPRTSMNVPLEGLSSSLGPCEDSASTMRVTLLHGPLMKAVSRAQARARRVGSIHNAPDSNPFGFGLTGAAASRVSPDTRGGTVPHRGSQLSPPTRVSTVPILSATAHEPSY